MFRHAVTQFLLWICFVELLQYVESAAVNFICKNPMDIRDMHGVKTDKIPGSRVEYNPFPGGFRITPGRTLHIDFKTSSDSGLIFLIGNLERADMVSAYLRRGHLTFARRCGVGRAFEIYRDRLDDNKWHSLTYHHSERGGRLFIDGHNPFRQYHLGPCHDFTTVLFGGLSPLLTGKPLRIIGNELESNNDRHESETMSRHRFFGCLRNMRIDSKVPTIQPRYYAVSQCD